MGGFSLGQPMPVTVDTVLFGLLALVAAISAVGVVAFGRTPVRSALSLVVNFLTLAIIYFTLGSEMLGIIQIVVYTGAIMVLFLFVIMLLNLGAQPPLAKAKDVKMLLAILVAAGLFAAVFAAVVLPMASADIPAIGKEMKGFGKPDAIGYSLLTEYVWPFEMASVLLLVGIVGSILLVKRRKQ